ncbi:MAG: hypothetical protein ACFB10_11655 [Salibacteraceae bacterium]
MADEFPKNSTAGWKLLLGAFLLIGLPGIAFFVLSPILSTPHPVADYLLKPYSESMEAYKQPGTLEEDWQASFELYQQEKYVESRQMLEAMQAKGQLKPQQQLLLGLSQLYQSPPQPLDAANTLNEAGKLPSPHQKEAQWWASLSYFLGDDRPNAHRLWAMMAADTSHTFHQQAKGVLAKVPPLEE